MQAFAHPPSQTVIKLRAPRPWFAMRIAVLLGQGAKLLVAINVHTPALILDILPATPRDIGDGG